MLSVLRYLMDRSSGSLLHCKVGGMLEIIPDLEVLEKQPSPRILNSHLRLNFLPRKQLEQVWLTLLVTEYRGRCIKYGSLAKYL